MLSNIPYLYLQHHIINNTNTCSWTMSYKSVSILITKLMYPAEYLAITQIATITPPSFSLSLSISLLHYVSIHYLSSINNELTHEIRFNENIHKYFWNEKYVLGNNNFLFTSCCIIINKIDIQCSSFSWLILICRFSKWLWPVFI